ncbi:P-selectin glycoprotein ligand 1 [Echeneis naucrates]|uniref:Selectin P ligand n=1 Tax=Echeneis naucrates TaxID=173247 RepID=A0A665W7G4_ECHNA|nr:P-selectin glycoprotein ligand 1 [Echeneis naucrates]
MMPLSVKAYLAMLWGMSVLFPLETTAASIPETSSNSTEPNKASGLPTVPPHDDTKSASWGPTPKDVAVDSRGSSGSTRGLVVMSTPTTGSLGDHTPTTRGDSQLFKNTTTPPTPTPPEHPVQQQSSAASTVMTDPPTAPTATSPRPTFRAKLDITTMFSPDNATENASHITSGPSAFTPTTEIASSTSELPPVTSLPVTKTETSTASTKLSSTSETGSNISISQFPGTRSLSSTTVSPTSTGSNDFNLSTPTSTTGLFVPHVPKRLPVPTAGSTAATTAAPNKVSRSPPCSTRALVKQSLIAIASLGGLAAIFMVSTIVLCTMLSARKHKVKKPQQATEMMCISALLPERDFSYTRQRNPISNGVLVIHTPGESDEDGGDNLTLSSFLPENDRFV